MTIAESLYFTYAGINSTIYNIANVRVNNSGMIDEAFGHSRSIKELSVRGRSKRYFQEIESSPLTLTLEFAFLDTWDDNKIREVRRWLLNQSYYQPLVFSENPDRIYYALCVDDPRLIHNGLKQGYIQLTFRCNDAYIYSPEYIKTFTCVGTTDIDFVNDGDVKIYPVLEIEKTNSNGSVKIINKSFGDIPPFEFFTGQKAKGTLYLNGTVYSQETVSVGDKTYEFYLGDDLKNSNNIKIDLTPYASKATGTLTFDGSVKSKEVATIGEETFEFTDSDDNKVSYGNIPVQIKPYMSQAYFDFQFGSNLYPLDRIKIGDINYEFVCGTTEKIVKIPSHGLTNEDFVYNKTASNGTINGFRSVGKYTNRDYIFVGDQNEYNLRNEWWHYPSISGQKAGDEIILYRYDSGVLSINKTVSTKSKIYLNGTVGRYKKDDLAVINTTTNQFIFAFIDDAGIDENGYYISFASDLPITSVADIRYVRFWYQYAIEFAEDVELTEGSVLVGSTASETVENFKNAILNNSIYAGIKFGLGNIAHPDVTTETISSNTLRVKAKAYGSIGNKIPYSIFNNAYAINATLSGIYNGTLTNGNDCSNTNALNALYSAFTTNTKQKINVTKTTNNITFASKIAGVKYNNIILTTTSPNITCSGSLFTGGTDPSTSNIINTLKNTINTNQSVILTLVSDTINNKIDFTYKQIGKAGNIPTLSDSLNIYWSSYSLIGGIDELQLGEIVTVDCENKNIISNLGLNRFEEFNGNYLTLLRGINRLQVTGDCIIKFKWQCKFL